MVYVLYACIYMSGSSKMQILMPLKINKPEFDKTLLHIVKLVKQINTVLLRIQKIINVHMKNRVK